MKIKQAVMAVAVMGILSCPEAWAVFPDQPVVELQTQSWGKVELLLFSGKGFASGYFHGFRTGNNYAYMMKAGISILRRSLIWPIGGLVNPEGEKTGFVTGPVVNVGGLAAALGARNFILDHWTFGAGLAIFPKAIKYDKGETHFDFGIHTGLTFSFGG